MTFQAWKMVFLNSMTFHDQGATCPLSTNKILITSYISYTYLYYSIPHSRDMTTSPTSLTFPVYQVFPTSEVSKSKTKQRSLSCHDSLALSTYRRFVFIAVLWRSADRTHLTVLTLPPGPLHRLNDCWRQFQAWCMTCTHTHTHTHTVSTTDFS